MASSAGGQKKLYKDQIKIALKSDLGTWRAWLLTVTPAVRCAKPGPKHWRRTGQPGARKGKKEGIKETQPRLPVPPLLHTHVPPATRPVDPG